MARKKILQFSCCAVSVIGILLMTLGIGLPIMIQNQVENTINGLWMKKNQYNSWGVLPGKLGLKVVRSYTLYNVTNPEGVWEGELPELVEIPAFPTEENSVWQDWEYVEKNLTGKGKEVETNYIAYHNKLNLDDLKQNGTVVPYDLPITLINAVWYGVLNSFKSASPVMFAMQNLHDMQVALSSDLYFTVISYALFETVLFNTTLTQNYLASIGLNDSQIEEVQTDEKYGWGSFETSKIWVQAYFDYNLSSSLDFGAFDILRNYFQISILSFAITPNGLISDSIQGILIDMVNRYGSENSTILGALQWANASLTLTPPLGLPPIQSSKFPFPSFASYNSTLDFPPEIKWLFPLLNITNLDFSPYAQSLLQVVYTYPNYNFQSIINIENLGFFLQNLILGNYTAIMQQ